MSFSQGRKLLNALQAKAAQPAGNIIYIFNRFIALLFSCINCDDCLMVTGQRSSQMCTQRRSARSRTAEQPAPQNISSKENVKPIPRETRQKVANVNKPPQETVQHPTQRKAEVPLPRPPTSPQELQLTDKNKCTNSGGCFLCNFVSFSYISPCH